MSDDIEPSRAYYDGWYAQRVRFPESEEYMYQYNLGYDHRAQADDAAAEPPEELAEPHPMDPRIHGDAEDHEDHFLGTITGRRALERAGNEGDF